MILINYPTNNFATFYFLLGCLHILIVSAYLFWISIHGSGVNEFSALWKSLSLDTRARGGQGMGKR